MVTVKNIAACDEEGYEYSVPKRSEGCYGIEESSCSNFFP